MHERRARLGARGASPRRRCRPATRAGRAGCARPRTSWRQAWPSCRSRASAPSSPGDGAACPFKGLAAFEVADAGYFFGRERLVAELVARLVGAPLVGVVGPSGSGKSSALRAGLLPALAAGVLPGSEHWAQALLRPGEHPLRALQDARPSLAPAALLVVDQFEEVFTACRDEDERRRSSTPSSRAGATRARRGGVVAVRADFYGRCAAYPALARLLGANHVLVGPMRRDELRRAIELPARRAGLLVDPELVDALVADVGDEPGGLPLLSTSLLELWQGRDGRRLRLAAYEQAGGVRGAVARLAERTYARLRRPQRIARAILLRLAGEGEGETVVRARVALDEFGGRPVPCSTSSPTAASSRSARARSRSRTRRCCASGRGCAAGWRRTPRGAGCTATCAPPRASGTPAAATPASCTAARAWPPRSTGRPATIPSSTPRERAFLAESRGRERARAAPPARPARRRRCLLASP